MKEKFIESLDNPLVKRWVRLRTKSSERAKEASVLVIGSHVIKELLGTLTPRVIMVRKGKEKPRENWIEVSDAVMRKITDLPMLPDWVAEFPLPQNPDFKACARLLVLDQIKDPGNLGTLLRTARAFGWHHVFLLEGSADPFAEKALQASKGACLHLAIKIGSIAELLSLTEKQKLPMFLADLHGASPESFSPPSSLALILGAEVLGISPELEPLGTKVSLPMAQNSESLNVAIAGGILMYLWRSP